MRTKAFNNGALIRKIKQEKVDYSDLALVEASFIVS